MKPPTFPAPEVRGKGHQSHSRLSLSDRKRRLTSSTEAAMGLSRFFSSFFSPSQQPSTCDEASRPPRCKACYHNPSQNKTERFPQRTRGQRTSIKGTVLTMRRSKTSSHVGLSESSFTAGLRNPVELSKVPGKLTVSGFWHVCQSVWVDFNLSLSQFHNLLLCSDGERTSLCAHGDF